MNNRIQELMNQAGTDSSGKWMGTDHAVKFAELIVKECIWAFGETRTEPSLEKYILDRLGINHGTENSGT